MKLIFVSFLSLIMLQSSAQFSVNSNNRYLLKDGKPFFWLGDTGWELFHRLDKTEAEKYLKRRSEQGFTVIQAVALAEMDGLHTPNANGDEPLMDDDPTKPNEKYFQHMDMVIDIAASYNINIALLPTWGDKVFKSAGALGLKFLMSKMPQSMPNGWPIVIRTKKLLSGYWAVTAFQEMKEI